MMIRSTHRRDDAPCQAASSVRGSAASRGIGLVAAGAAVCADTNARVRWASPAGAGSMPRSASSGPRARRIRSMFFFSPGPSTGSASATSTRRVSASSSTPRQYPTSSSSRMTRLLVADWMTVESRINHGRLRHSHRGWRGRFAATTR